MEPLIALGMLFGAGFVGLFFLYCLGGFFILQPRTQVVVLRFGRYTKTIVDEGIHWIFPFGRRLYRLSSQLVSVELPRTTVLDAHGNPIEVSAICTYQIREARAAVLEVVDVASYVQLLAGAVVKNVCAQYPYASTDAHEPCLRKENEVITKALVDELQELVAPGGVQIYSVRLNDLTYAPEIAQSMLLRQQAQALVDARRTIVEGAVSTVTSARERIEQAGLRLDEPLIENLTSNLLLVLTSGERVQTFMPVAVTRETQS